jgi:hypothetical protein
MTVAKNQFLGTVPLRKPPLQICPFLGVAPLRQLPLKIVFLGTVVFTESPLVEANYQRQFS